MPSWLLWLAPLPLATVGAIAWTAWAGRTRRPAEGAATVASYERFRAALAAPAPAGHDATPAPPRTAGPAGRPD